MPGIVRWHYYDPKTGENWTVPINPNEMTSPWSERNYIVKATTAGPAGGVPVVFEGVRQPRQWTFSGTTLDLAHHDELLRWAMKPNKVFITDHFGRTFAVMLDHFDAIPKQRASHMQRHTYTMRATIFYKVGLMAL